MSKTKDFNELEAAKIVQEKGPVSLEQKKIEALKKLDNAKFGWFHVRAIIVSGLITISFFRS